MAAGLGFKTFTTGEVLTAADTNGYLMQGILVFASAAARDAAVTSPQEGQFAYLKDTNVTTYYTGSAWANVDTTGMTNPMTTTGDSIYSSSGSTPARLGIGSTGQVLTVASGLPSWATPASSGGMTLISTTTLTGAGITLSSIPQTYNDLRIYIKNYKPVSASGIGCRVNGLSTTIYRSNQEYSEAGADNRAATGTYWEIFARNQNTTTSESLADYVMPDYTNSTTWKYVSGRSIANNPTTATNYNFTTFWAPVRQTAAITQLEFFSFGGDFTSGTLLLYGVK